MIYHLVWVGVAGAYQLFVGVEQHPELRFVLRLIEQVAKQRDVGRNIGGLGHCERVCRLERVDLTVVWHRITLRGETPNLVIGRSAMNKNRGIVRQFRNDLT